MSAEPNFSVARRDFVRRSRITLRCDGCGSTEIHCNVGDAYVYEAGLREHVCRISGGSLNGRPALVQMLKFMSGGGAA